MDTDHFPRILGSASLNEKGQLVIPVEARKEMGLEAGSRLVLLKVPNKNALMLIKAEAVESMVRKLTDALNRPEKKS